MRGRILIVEDDPEISKLIGMNFALSDYQTVCATDGPRAVEAIRTQQFDLALCDIALRGSDGFDLLPYMKEKGVPVILMSAKADLQSQARGPKRGAEDCPVNPFDIPELLARMEKKLTWADKQPKRLVYRDIVVDEECFSVAKDGKPILLRRLEYELLVTFLRRPGMVMTREDLLRQVWGDEYMGETRTVDVHVASLRRKLDLTQELATVFKTGYRLEPDKGSRG